MRPAAFAYHRARTRTEVDEMLEALGPGAKILAGGQSLVPIMNFRLAEPEALVDINHLGGEPDGVADAGESVVFGPLVRQAAVEASRAVAERVPLLAEAMMHVAHPAIRSRGTVCGSIAHADPAAELPAVLVALGGEVRARSAGGTRTVAAGDFFAGPLENSLRPGEWVEEVRFPARRAGEGFAFEEFARRSGDYALCGVAAVARRGDGGVDVSLTYLGMGDAPRTVALGRVEPEGMSAGSFPDEVGRRAADVLDPVGDVHATRAYRMFLAARLGARAARRAAGEARGAG